MQYPSLASEFYAAVEDNAANRRYERETIAAAAGYSLEIV